MVLVVYAMAVMVLYIGVLAFGNFFVRKAAVKHGKLNLGFFKVYDSKAYEVPEAVLRYGRHFDNQFQMPVVFLITCLSTLHVPINPLAASILAWIFVVSRFIHTWVHLGSNNVILRAAVYGVGVLTVMVMWLFIVAKIFYPGQI